MSRKRELVLVVDVETADMIENPKVYDLGYAVVERSTGNVIEEHSLVISDIFYGQSDLMQSAYYAEKLPQYDIGIVNGDWKVVKAWTAWRMVKDIMKKYNITRVYAYNCAFDRRALNGTMRFVSGGTCRNFFPRGTKFCDIWHMACTTILRQKRYRKFAEANGLVSPFGNLRTSAEAAYAYMTNTPEYAEPHTGLADVHIEIAIMMHVLRQKKKITEAIVPNPWRLAQVA